MLIHVLGRIKISKYQLSSIVGHERSRMSRNIIIRDATKLKPHVPLILCQGLSPLVPSTSAEMRSTCGDDAVLLGGLAGGLEHAYNKHSPRTSTSKTGWL